MDFKTLLIKYTTLNTLFIKNILKLNDKVIILILESSKNYI